MKKWKTNRSDHSLGTSVMKNGIAATGSSLVWSWGTSYKETGFTWVHRNSRCLWQVTLSAYNQISDRCRFIYKELYIWNDGRCREYVWPNRRMRCFIYWTVTKSGLSLLYRLVLCKSCTISEIHIMLDTLKKIGIFLLYLPLKKVCHQVSVRKSIKYLVQRYLLHFRPSQMPIHPTILKHFDLIFSLPEKVVLTLIAGAIDFCIEDSWFDTFKHITKFFKIVYGNTI